MLDPILQWHPSLRGDALERWNIERHLNYHNGVKAKAAYAIGINVRTLETKLDKYAIDDSESTHREQQRKKEKEDFLLRCRGQHPDQRPDAKRPGRDPQPAAAAKDGNEPDRGSSSVGEPLPVSDEPTAVPGLLSAKSVDISSGGRKRPAKASAV